MPEPAAGAGPTEMPRLSIVLAVLNERKNLPELFERLRAVRLPSWEAIVADDGSTDGTREFVRELAATDPRIRLVLHEGKQTTLTAQCRAIETARGSYIAVMDSDLQHPPELLEEMVRQLDAGATVVVASRYIPGGSPGPRPALRAVYSLGAEYVARALVPPVRAVADPVSGYFAFRRAIFVPLARGYRGYKLLLFVLVMSRGRGVREVPFRLEPRGEGATKVASGVAFMRRYLIEVVLARRLDRDLRRGRLRPVVATDS